jgi:hypothetical protein
MAIKQKPGNGSNGKKNGKKHLCPRCFRFPVMYGSGPKDLCGVCRPTTLATKRRERKDSKRIQAMGAFKQQQ